MVSCTNLDEIYENQPQKLVKRVNNLLPIAEEFVKYDKTPMEVEAHSKANDYI